jgi:methylglutaconyl-CoA hydratase
MAALRSEQAGDVLRITMSRPEQRNAFDAALIQELTTAFSEVPDDVWAVVLAGDGQSFSRCRWRMRAAVGSAYEENVADARRLRKMLETIDSSRLR